MSSFSFWMELVISRREGKFQWKVFVTFLSCMKLIVISSFRYEEAKEAKASRMSKHQQTYGPKGNKGGGGFNENTEKTLYVGLVSHLKENVSAISCSICTIRPPELPIAT